MKNRKRKMRLLEQMQHQQQQQQSKIKKNLGNRTEKSLETFPSKEKEKKSLGISKNKNHLPIVKKRKDFEKFERRLQKKPDIWFDGVDPALIAASREDQTRTYQLYKPNSYDGPTKHVAIDCEFVGVGYQGKDSVLARVSIVNQFGHVLLDKFVKPKEKVTDYRTRFSGVRPKDLVNAETFEVVHGQVAKILKDRIIVGHAIRGDMKVLFLSHPRHMIRDTSRYLPFRELVGGKTPSLRNLTKLILGLTIQEGEHDSVTDARATMCLYLSRKVEWEAKLKQRIKMNSRSKQK